MAEFVSVSAAGRSVSQTRRLRFGDSAQVNNIDRYREMERDTPIAIDVCVCVCVYI